MRAVHNIRATKTVRRMPNAIIVFGTYVKQSRLNVTSNFAKFGIDDQIWIFIKQPTNDYRLSQVETDGSAVFICKDSP